MSRVNEQTRRYVGKYDDFAYHRWNPGHPMRRSLLLFCLFFQVWDLTCPSSWWGFDLFNHAINYCRRQRNKNIPYWSKWKRQFSKYRTPRLWYLTNGGDTQDALRFSWVWRHLTKTDNYWTDPLITFPFRPTSGESCVQRVDLSCFKPRRTGLAHAALTARDQETPSL